MSADKPRPTAMEGRHIGHATDAAFHDAFNPDAPAPTEQLARHRAVLRAKGVDEATVMRLYPYDFDGSA